MFGFFHLLFFLSCIDICMQKQALDSTGSAVWSEKMVPYCSNVAWEDRKAVQRKMA
jgi:hypothetical protein